ncbi:MAG: phosphonate ABC transporter ATP-binding protein [Coriobacteriales bacterium]
MSDKGPLLDIENLDKTYDGGHIALKGASLCVKEGEFVSLIGPSGAGKSTLLRCINGLVEPSAGNIRFKGAEVTGLHGGKLRKLRRQVSMVFQNYNLISHATAIENVLHGRLGYKSSLAGSLGIYSREERAEAAEALALVGLEQCAYMRADQLSGGQRQRVGIARAFVQDPLLILADEPIASLDPKASRTVMEHLRWASDERGTACLVSLHQVEYAQEFSDRIVAISKGTIVFDGTPDELDEAEIARIYGDEDPTVSNPDCC